MNLLLHGIGRANGPERITVHDSLAEQPKRHATLVLANPSFGRKSGLTSVDESGRVVRDDVSYNRTDFWKCTTNKQLNFVQHIYTLLKRDGRAAVVVPDNVLFEGGAGEEVRRRLLKQCDLHTMLRLPTGIVYAGGVKANVLFFERKQAGDGRGPSGRGCTTSAPGSTSSSASSSRSVVNTSTTSCWPTSPASRVAHGRRASGSGRSLTTRSSRGTRRISTSPGSRVGRPQPASLNTVCSSRSTREARSSSPERRCSIHWRISAVGFTRLSAA